jgi:alkanesulfonate monooxygenase SsuD/methylene tetrahydromethanopterin reductase-like flavin-dependent oxidoreductase (luciferase family)
VSFHGDHYDVEASVRPLPVQRPRIPIWVAGVAPHTRPVARAKRWDGFIPISNDFLDPEQLASYVGEHPHPEWDVAAQRTPGVPVDELAAAGATWLVSSTWPHEEGWREELRALVSTTPG